MSSPTETPLIRGSQRGRGGVRTRGGRGSSQVSRSPTETPLIRGSQRGRGVRTRGGRGSSQAIRSPNANVPSDHGSHRGHGSRGGRGRRGGPRGRGGHDSRPSQAASSELDLIRAQRQLTQKRVAALPTEVKKELLSRKRDAEVARVIMPDAPPRKRRARLASPERESCEFAEPASNSQRNKIIILENIQLVPPRHEIMVNVDIHNVPQSPPRDVEIDEIPQSPARDVEIQDLEEQRDLLRIENMVAEADETVTVTVAPSTSKQLSSIGVSEKNADETIGEWLKLTDDLSDCDVDTEDEDCFLPGMTSCNVTAEPALDTDMTLYQIRVLETEDRQNDQAIREIAPPDSYNFDWKKDRQIFTGRRETFTGIPGPTFPLTDQTTMVDIFYKMIDTDFIDRICTETNRYADQKINLLKSQNKFLPTLRLYRWTPTDRDEMVSFLVISILQGLYPLPEEESYFGFNGFGTMPYFRKIMSYNRFLLLKSLIHFVDNETITEPDKLCKIQMVSDYFNDKFSHLYNPSQEIVIDESLLKWHGRLGFAQKILSKAAQVGVKTYELCESSSGYLWKFFIYAGKQNTGTTTATATTSDEPNHLEIDETNPLDTADETNPLESLETDEIPDERPGSRNVRPSNATAKIVYDLVEPLLHRGHTLIMDNFYNSPLLARCLKRQQTDCFGTLRLNREFVPDSLKTITKSELRQGEVLASYCSDLSVIVWRDANIVSMLSTYHSLQIGTRQKYNRLTYKPSVVLDYNKAMGGVDRKDQFLSAHPMERQRNRIWYKKVFRRLFNCAIFNCFIIFKSANPTISHRQFRITLAENLLKIHRRIDLTTEPRLINSKTGQSTKPTTRPILEHRHFPVKTGFKQSRCWLCAQRKVVARTVWKCLECNINLCIDGCFMAYHT